MNEFAFARVLHVLGVVFWIGGVAMVTTVLIPAMAQMRSSSERMEFFGRIESRFAPQARFTTLLVGLSGFYMVHILNAWSRFAELRYWWMHAMVLVWGIFTLMLFVVEPFVLRRQVRRTDNGDPDKNFRRMRRMHQVLLSLSLVAVAGAVAGSHGWMLPGD
ncbi:CopD family protein [Nitrosospira sp. Is2]|uniref:CopD family protein n=1 Tax=Nitrosospira sp. Is2 TaxID=3080532 RepID=UPI002952D346|nr:CopD family protein [Nitrosospira sp. Is2]WON74558.1 CopD family protein [Nitrosospira sp. Is2]